MAGRSTTRRTSSSTATPRPPGTSTSTSTPSTPSPDHSLLAWSSDTDGGERYTLRVRDLATGDDLADELTGTSSWGGVAWSGDGQWLFYARPDAAMRPYQIWRHRLGTPVDDDVLVVEEPDERFFLGVSLTRSEQWIVLTAESNTTSEVSVVPAGRPDGRARARAGPGRATSSTPSTTGATASSSSPTSTPPTSA